MKQYHVTMVHPRQIVNKQLKGCSNSRIVTTFAQKHGVPCVWWSPSRNQRVLLVDWQQFRATWNRISVEHRTATSRPTVKAVSSARHEAHANRKPASRTSRTTVLKIRKVAHSKRVIHRSLPRKIRRAA